MSTRNNRSNRKKGKVRRWLDSLSCFSSPEDPVAPLSGVKSGPWEGLRATLKTLRDTPAMFGPLVSAASVLLDCFDIIEAVSSNQQDYEDLATSLDALSKAFMGTYTVNISSSATGCVQGIVVRVLMASADEQDLMRRYRRIQSFFDSCRPISDEYIGKHGGTGGGVYRNSRLATLNTENKATYDSLLSASTNRRTCTEGTRVKSVYWMSGMAGTGKTTIACTFAKWLEGQKLLAASFFCTRTDADCQVARIIPTVAYQLARYCIPFRSALCDILGNDPDLRTKDVTKQFERLLVDPLKTIKNDIPNNLVVVIDALDECNDQRGVEQVLDMLFKHASQLPIKFFVRVDPKRDLYNNDDPCTVACGDIPTRHRKVAAARDRSGVLFIYAATLVRYIRPGTGRADPRERLNTVLGMTAESGEEKSQIDILYAAVLKSALDDGELRGPEKEAVQAVLRTVLFAQEPISLETIGALSGINNTHQVEYALNGLRSTLCSARPGQADTTATSRSTVQAGESMLWGDERPATVQHMRFAILVHTRQPGRQHTTPNQDQDLVYTGVCMPLLAESSGSDDGVGRHGDGAEGVCIGSAAVLDGGDVPAARAAVWDPWESRLNHPMCGNGSKMPRTSAPAMRQPSVAIHSTYLHLMPAFLSSVELGIHALLASDARAAGAEGKPDGPQRDSRSGNLEHGSPVYSVAYSVDGSRVAVGCEDGTVSIRNAYDGTVVVGPLQAHTTMSVRWCSRVMAGLLRLGQMITLSACGTCAPAVLKRIVSGSQDNTVCIWSVADGTLLCGPLQGHTDWVRSVTYSPDGTLIASASDDKTIRLWRSDNGTPAASPLQGHTRGVYSVVFSLDGTLLVSGSGDKTFGHTDEVNSVVVSADGTLVVSGSDDGTVRVWRIADGSLAAGPFVGHTARIWSVGYSPDETRVISGSGDRTVRVWNVREGIAAPASSDHALPKIQSLRLSPDNGHVLTESDEGQVQMWDVLNGTSQWKLVQVVRTDDKTVAAGPFDPASRVWQFTDDSSCVIVGFGDGTIRGISLRTGESVFVLRSDGDDFVDLIAQCSDGSLLASVDDNSYSSRSLRVWSITLPIIGFHTLTNAPSASGSSQTLSDLYDGCHVDRDGWLVNSRDDLLLWLPAEMADAGLSPFVSVIVTTSGTLEVPKQWLVAGNEGGQMLHTEVSGVCVDILRRTSNNVSFISQLRELISANERNSMLTANPFNDHENSKNVDSEQQVEQKERESATLAR
ncbi:WD40 repeat-like protein [Rhizoctonia solani]|uniref:WD40 repeat-like protein n=2 Tax=Rhizoctonia solani TaxID=456999 RepID=A0A8H7I3V0_9AGAM|nr:WD40 repeat-like protein [Rhizoctonia solani]